LKIKKITILLICFALFNQCDEKTKEPVSNLDIVRYNAQAAMYFHTIFSEAEFAWAYVHNKDYYPFTNERIERSATVYKELNYDGSTVTVAYNAWTTDNGLIIVGDLRVESVTLHSYRNNEKTVKITLDIFSINRQHVRGHAWIQPNNKEDNPNDFYLFTLSDGATIHEDPIKNEKMPTLISASIERGSYERVQGGETLLDQVDDVWIYSGGIMKGIILNDSRLSYTNTIINTSIDANTNENIDTKLRFSANCITAQWGVSKIVISERPDIIFIYKCSEIEYESEPVNVY